jgi:hypothetical protein
MPKKLPGWREYPFAALLKNFGTGVKRGVKRFGFGYIWIDKKIGHGKKEFLAGKLIKLPDI